MGAMSHIGRNTWIGVGIGASAGAILLVFLIKKRRKARKGQLLPQDGASTETGYQCGPPAREAGEDAVIAQKLDELFVCVSTLREEVSELRGSLQGIATQIAQDVRSRLEESHKVSRRRRYLMNRERTDSMSSSSIYFTASSASVYDGESEGGYTTANPESDYNGESEKEVEQETEDEEEKSCATVKMAKQDSPEDGEVGENTLPLDSVGENQELLSLLDESDSLHSGELDEKAEGFQLLQANKTLYGENNEFLWRLARAYHDMFEITEDKEEKDLYYKQGRSEAGAALQKEGLSAECHKWFAVLTRLTSGSENMHDHVQRICISKEHLERAVALKSDDPDCFYLLGRCCYEVSSLGWLEKKTAAALFETAPSATLQDALEHFLKAEELKPGFSKNVRLYIAKCHKDLGNVPDARHWAELASHTLSISNSEADIADLNEVWPELYNEMV